MQRVEDTTPDDATTRRFFFSPTGCTLNLVATAISVNFVSSMKQTTGSAQPIPPIPSLSAPEPGQRMPLNLSCTANMSDGTGVRNIQSSYPTMVQ